MQQSELSSKFHRSIALLSLGMAFHLWFVYTTITEIIPSSLLAHSLLTAVLAAILTVVNLRFWLGGLVIAAILLQSFVQEQPRPTEHLHVIWISWQVIVDVAFLVISCRMNVVAKQLGLSWKTRTQVVLELQHLWKRGSFENWMSVVLQTMRECGLILQRVLLPVLLAVTLMMVVTPGRESIGQYRLIPGGLQAIQIGLILATSFFLMATLLNAWNWRQLSPAQSWIYLRSVTLNWLGPDLRGVARRRRKKRKPLNT